MKKIFLLTLFISIVLIGFTQNSNIKIMDLTVNPVQETDTALLPSTLVKYNIKFKVNNKINSNIVNVLFGTANDLGDVLTKQLNIVQVSGNYYIDNNGVQTLISNYTGSIEIELSQQQNNLFNTITLYVEDNSGLNTNKLYFNK